MENILCVLSERTSYSLQVATFWWPLWTSLII